MNPLKKGPELKMPDLKLSSVKVPAVVEDLFYDLRDRRLLPLVALAVVAIVAVPLLLSRPSESSSAPEAGPPGPAVASGAAKASHLVVAEADPGLRVPRKRLAKRPEKDPFQQKFVAPVANAGAAAQTPETTTTTTSTTVTSGGNAPPSGSSPSPSPGSSPAASPPAGGGGGAGNLAAFTYAIDVKITRIETAPDGSTKRGEPSVHDGVVPPAVLPSEKEQVITYMGLSPKTRKPLFLVSTDVSGMFGEGKCVSGTTTCQLLEMEDNPRFPETFSYGDGHVRYKVAVLKVETVRVPTSKSSRGAAQNFSK